MTFILINVNIISLVYESHYSLVPDGQPRSLRIDMKESTWVHVAWSIPLVRDRNGIVISYVIEVTPKLGNLTVHLLNPIFSTPELITYNITGLSPGTEYTVRVAASTVNGTGPFSRRSMIRTKDDCKFFVLHGNCTFINLYYQLLVTICILGLYLILSVVPGPVSNLTFTVSSSTEVKVLWEEPKNPNGIIVRYSVIYKVIDGMRSIHSTTKSKMVTLQHLGQYNADFSTLCKLLTLFLTL